jgi:tryptophan synthase beta chain
MSKHYLKNHPAPGGWFGEYGGAFLPPQLEEPFAEIAAAYARISRSADFQNELAYIRRHYVGRPSPLYLARRWSDEAGGARIYFKREDLNHTGAHKVNNTVGQALLAKRMGKPRVIAETGAGQHGVALATAAAYFGLACEIHMGEVDIAKEHPNVVRMRLLGATVVPVGFGGRTLKEAVDSAFQSYLQDPVDSIYAIGSVVGPHPFPMMVRDFQRIVGQEARTQFAEMTGGEMPDHVMACVGGGSNAMGIFQGFIDDEDVQLHGVEPLGRGTRLGEHSATITFGRDGQIHGFRTLLLTDEEGEPAPVHSIASGLDYPGVGPEHAYLHKTGRAQYAAVDDNQALDAFYRLSREEGIIPALESAHAVAYAIQRAPEWPGQTILVNLSGRGDKDIDYVVEHFGYGA